MITLLVASLTVLAPQQRGQGIPVPQRDVTDPGVVATGQRVTPVGVQTVFTGKVGGVRFGKSSGELWVAVPNYAYHLDWRANRVIAQGRTSGRPGVSCRGRRSGDGAGVRHVGQPSPGIDDE